MFNLELILQDYTIIIQIDQCKTDQRTVIMGINAVLFHKVKRKSCTFALSYIEMKNFETGEAAVHLYRTLKNFNLLLPYKNDTIGAMSGEFLQS